MANAEADAMCAALREFSDSIDDSEVHEVTLRTNWGAEPQIACGRRDKAPENDFCSYLVENSSIEFMLVNVRRVLECIGIDFSTRSHQVSVNNLTGTVTSLAPAFTDEALEIVVSFDTTSDEASPSMTISMRKPGGAEN